MRGLAVTMMALAAAGCIRLPTLDRAPDRPPPRPAAGTGGLIDARIDGGTFARITAVSADPARCEAELEAARVNFVPTPDGYDSDVCYVRQGGVLGPDMGTRARMSPAEPTLTCRLAVALSVWRRQSVEPAAREILGAEVAQIDHMGVYACRSVNSRPGARPSAHARAAAIDFSGVRLTDGRRITVSGDWNGSGAEARFLRRIRDDACQVFGTTLSPDYNAQHHDHLHLEAEDGRLCR